MAEWLLSNHASLQKTVSWAAVTGREITVSFRWPLRWNRRCLSQIDNSKLTAEPLSFLQRLSVEHNVNHKTDTFALVGYTLQ